MRERRTCIALNGMVERLFQDVIKEMALRYRNNRTHDLCSIHY